MNTSEAGMILAVIKAAYPHSYKDLSESDAIATVNLWAQMFDKEPYEAVNAAVKALIATRQVGYSPTIGEVKEKLRTLGKAEDMNDGQAWALVTRACKNGLYGYKQEFDKLPPAVQKAVGSAEQLRDWAMMDEETFQSVVGSTFRKTFKTVSDREREDALIPGSVKNVVASLSQGFAFPKLEAGNGW